MTTVRRSGGEPSTEQSRSWTRRKVRAAHAVVQTYARSLSSQGAATLRARSDRISEPPGPIRSRAKSLRDVWPELPEPRLVAEDVAQDAPIGYPRRGLVKSA